MKKREKRKKSKNQKTRQAKEIINEEKAKAYYQKAIALNPNYADAYIWYSNSLEDYSPNIMKLREQAVQISPLSLIANISYGISLTEVGRFDEAKTIARTMLSIDNNSHQAYALLSTLGYVQEKYAESTFYRNKAVQLNASLVNKFRVTNSLADIGLSELTPEIMAGTGFEIHSLYLTGNNELYISQTIDMLPRSEKDELGSDFRAIAEMMSGNYKEAIKYFKKASCESCYPLIHSLIQSGDEVISETLLTERKKEHQAALKMGNVIIYDFYRINSIDIDSMEIALLEGDIDSAIGHLEDAMKNNYILNFRFINTPRYLKLREHSGWPALLAESNSRAAVQGAIYQKMVAADSGNKL